MSFFLFDEPIRESDRSILNNSVLDDFENEFFGHPFAYPHYGYHGHPKNGSRRNNQKQNVNSSNKRASHSYDNDVYKLVDFCPKTNLGEDETNYYIQVDLPGMTKDQIKMELANDNTLTISGERIAKKSESMKFTKMDCQYGKFSRSFSLPENAKLEGISAKMENGVLEVIIPKAEPPKNQRRTIQIQ